MKISRPFSADAAATFGTRRGARPPRALLDAPRVQCLAREAVLWIGGLCCASGVSREGAGNSARGGRAPQAAFTMVEIAISLAVIGIALVAIIGVLPIGMNTQRDNREETIINQDATVFIEAIRGGARGLDDLTNYVYAITNYWGQYNSSGVWVSSKANSYTYAKPLVAPGYYSLFGSPITNGMNIIGLLSTPEFTDVNGAPLANITGINYYSNHVVAYVRSISGPAVEKPPQPNDSIIREDSFGYRILCVNAPVAVDTNIFGLPAAQQLYTKQLAANLHELRLTFLWPQLPNGNVGPGRQTFRTMVAGQVLKTNGPGNMPVYFYQSQSFVNAP